MHKLPQEQQRQRQTRFDFNWTIVYVAIIKVTAVSELASSSEDCSRFLCFFELKVLKKF